MKNNYIRIILGIVFLSAGVVRLCNSWLIEMEMSNLHLPFWIGYFVIIFEIIVWTCFLIWKYVKIALYLTAAFLGVAIINSIIINYSNILNSINELFIFDPTPTDVWLHAIYLMLIWFLLSNYNK